MKVLILALLVVAVSARPQQYNPAQDVEFHHVTRLEQPKQVLDPAPLDPAQVQYPVEQEPQQVQQNKRATDDDEDKKEEKPVVEEPVQGQVVNKPVPLPAAVDQPKEDVNKKEAVDGEAEGEQGQTVDVQKPVLGGELPPNTPVDVNKEEQVAANTDRKTRQVKENKPDVDEDDNVEEQQGQVPASGVPSLGGELPPNTPVDVAGDRRRRQVDPEAYPVDVNVAPVHHFQDTYVNVDDVERRADDDLPNESQPLTPGAIQEQNQVPQVVEVQQQQQHGQVVPDENGN